MGILDENLGSLLIASWFDMMQLMLEISQVIRYFRVYPNDRTRLKVLVIGLLLSDIVAEAGHNILIYLYTITNWGNPPFLEDQHWPVGVFLPANGLNALAVQMFLLHRLWTLQRKWYVVAPLAMLSLASFGGIISTATISMLNPSLTKRALAVNSSIIWLGCGALADCSIAGSLVWQLSRMVTPFEHTKGTINRLMAYSVSTGAAPALLALASLVCFLVDQESNVCVAFGFVLGRTYTLTLLWNLNSRQKLREDSSNGTITFNRRRQSMITHGEVIDMKPTVSVVRTVQVDHDGDYDNTDMNSGSYRQPTHPDPKSSYHPFSDV